MAASDVLNPVDFFLFELDAIAKCLVDSRAFDAIYIVVMAVLLRR